LLTLHRAYGGTVSELRLTAEEYNGHPYLALRIWQPTEGGEWRPTRKGVSIRISECARLAEALDRAAISRPTEPPPSEDGRRPATPSASAPPWFPAASVQAPEPITSAPAETTAPDPVPFDELAGGG
jgi:hypothetical protein